MVEIKYREKIQGYSVDLKTFDEAVAFINKAAENTEGLQVVTINPEMIELANKNSEFAQILNSSGLVVPDGVGIKIALKLKGINQEQVRGIDLAKKSLELCSQKGYKCALIGAKPHVIEKAVDNLKSEISNLDIAYYKDGYFSQEEEENIINELIQAKPQLVLVALGAPKQEIFIKKCLELHKAVYIGVGGSFDVWAGEVERAPEIFQKTGFEWLYRTISQPQRFKRIYKTLPLFLFKAIIEAVRDKFKNSPERK